MKQQELAAAHMDGHSNMSRERAGTAEELGLTKVSEPYQSEYQGIILEL
jgi:hypothetical protein